MKWNSRKIFRVPKQMQKRKSRKQKKLSRPEGNFDLTDGFYKGSGTGFAGSVSVSVEIKDKSIIFINILSTG